MLNPRLREDRWRNGTVHTFWGSLITIEVMQVDEEAATGAFRAITRRRALYGPDVIVGHLVDHSANSSTCALLLLQRMRVPYCLFYEYAYVLRYVLEKAEVHLESRQFVGWIGYK